MFPSNLIGDFKHILYMCLRCREFSWVSLLPPQLKNFTIISYFDNIFNLIKEINFLF